MAFKMKGSSFYGSTPFKQVKTKNFGPRAAKGDDDQSKELARSRYEMGEYKNDPTGQANFKPAYEGADYSKKDIAKMNSKQKKDIE